MRDDAPPAASPRRWGDAYEGLRLTRDRADPSAGRNGRAVLLGRGMAAWFAVLGLERTPAPRPPAAPAAAPEPPGGIASGLAEIIASIVIGATTGDPP